MKMKMTQSGVELLIQLEGIKLSVYKDVAGYPTLGVGHLLTQSERSSGKITLKLAQGVSVIDFRKGIRRAEAILILQKDLVRFVACVNKAVNTPLNQHQFNALVSFAFNIGCTAFKNSTLLKKLNQGQHDAVPAQFKRWVRAGGKKVKGLVNRRNAEIKLWRSSVPAVLTAVEFSPEKTITLDQTPIPTDENYQIIKAIAQDLGVW